MDQSISANSSSRIYWSIDDIRRRIAKSKVVIFAKGTPLNPGCGYSEQAMAAVEDCGKPYEVVDVCEDRSIVAALRAFAGRKSLPMVFVNGDLVSTSDNQRDVVESGALKDRIEKAFS